MKKLILTFLLLFLVEPKIVLAAPPSTSQLEPYVLSIPQYPDANQVPEELKALLAEKVNEFLSGNYVNFYLRPGKTEGRRVFFIMETVYSLSIAYPYLPDNLKNQVATFLNNHLKTYDFFYGDENGIYSLDSLKTASESQRRQYHQLTAESFSGAVYTIYKPDGAERGYVFWTYCYYLGKNRPEIWQYCQTKWPQIRDRTKAKINPDDPATLLGEVDQWNQPTQSINRRTASLIGFTRMAHELEDTEYSWGLNAATKALQARLNYEEVNRPADTGIGEWYDPKWDGSQTGKFYKTTWNAGNWISRYQSLIPEIAQALKDFYASEMQRQNEFIDTVLPARNMAWTGHATGEIYTVFPQQAQELFLAKALIMQEPQEKLKVYLDVPWCQADLYYLERLVQTIRASGGSPNPTPTPTPTSTCTLSEDVNCDSFVNAQDALAILSSWLTGGSSGYNFREDINGDEKINGLDLGYVIKSWP